MKHTFAIIAALFFGLSLTACSSNAAPQAPTTQAQTTLPEITQPEVTVPSSDNPHIHTHAITAQDPTCTAPGKTIYTCPCGDTYFEEIEAMGHSWSQWELYKQATGTAEGERRRTCTQCDHYESQPIPMLENIFTNDNNYYDADTVSIKPQHVYWQEGKLFAECYVINGYDCEITNIAVQSLAFNNCSTEVASAIDFGVLEGVTLPPYSHIVWTFVFSEDAVQSYGADLTQLGCMFDVTCDQA